MTKKFHSHNPSFFANDLKSIFLSPRNRSALAMEVSNPDIVQYLALKIQTAKIVMAIEFSFSFSTYKNVFQKIL